MKKCSKCGLSKSLKDFQALRTSSDGKRPECKECSKVAGARYRKQNPEIIAARKKLYYEKFKERIMEQHREYRAADPDKIYALYKNYRDRNRKKIAEWWKKSPRGRFGVLLQLALKRRVTKAPITIDELMELWVRQRGTCLLSGLKMTWNQGKTEPTSLSIDRIDSNKGYEKGNVRLVCYQVNAFRNRWSDEQMIAMARAIIAQSKKTKQVH